MMGIEDSLAECLEDAGVELQIIDESTLKARQVPLPGTEFSKEHTNLLVKIGQEGEHSVLGVDEDLRYTGSDPALSRLFEAASITDRGWRLFMLHSRDPNLALRAGLELCGFDGEPRAPALALRSESGQGQNSLMERLGQDLTAKVQAGQGTGTTIGREGAMTDILACLLPSSVGRLVVLVSAPGEGKSNLLFGVTGGLLAHAPDQRVVALDLGEVFAGTLWHSARDQLVESLLQEAREKPGTILALEHLELLPEAPHGVYLVAGAIDRGQRLLATILNLPPLANRTFMVQLAELDRQEVLSALMEHAKEIGGRHQVAIDKACGEVAYRLAHDRVEALPGAAIGLLELAAARARLTGSEVVGPDDVIYASLRLWGKKYGD